MADRTYYLDLDNPSTETQIVREGIQISQDGDTVILNGTRDAFKDLLVVASLREIDQAAQS